MKNLLTALLLCCSIFCIQHKTSCQTYNPYYASIVDSSSFDTVLNNLIAFENLGVKEHGTEALENTKNWIIDQYTNYGYTDIVEDPFTYSGNTTSNIIITKTGTVYPNEYLIIDAHYDTRRGPGTNDNGSGTVLLFEIARLLINIDLEYSVKFIHFSGEEDGLIGSTHYVNNVVKPTNLDILLVFNIDQVGGTKGASNNIIVCERDLSNPSSNNSASNTFTNILANCVSLYSSLTPGISYAYGSDYVPFQNNGEVITGLYEKNESPYAHTTNDLLVNMVPEYAHEVTKASIGAALHFAKAVTDTSNTDTTTVGISNNNFEESILIYPSPTKGQVIIDFGTPIQHVDLELYNTNGQLIKQFNHTNSQRAHLNINGPSGVYFLKILAGNEYASYKLIKYDLD